MEEEEEEEEEMVVQHSTGKENVRHTNNPRLMNLQMLEKEQVGSAATHPKVRDVVKRFWLKGGRGSC